MSPRPVVAALAAAAAVSAGAVLSGCGASHAISQAFSDPVARAAEITAQAPGYRLSGTFDVNVAGHTVTATMNGEFVRSPVGGEIRTQIAAPGRTVTVQERIVGHAIYVRIPGGGNAATGGKPWAKINLGQFGNGATSLNGLTSAGSDPGRYIDFLRAAGARITKLGPATVRGVPATRYHTVVDLNRYAALVPAADRAQAEQAVARTESVLNAHTLPVDVWLDHQGRVRQLQMVLGACLAGHHLAMNMTMNMYDFGRQTVPPAPSADQVATITPPTQNGSQSQSQPSGCAAA